MKKIESQIYFLISLTYIRTLILFRRHLHHYYVKFDLFNTFVNNLFKYLSYQINAVIKWLEQINFNIINRQFKNMP
jgi:hypothetical protein